MRHCFVALFIVTAAFAAEKTETNKPPATTNKTEVSIFPDKKLEAAVRKFVFEKRDNDKPIVEADVINLSTIQGKGMGITNLAGLEKCRSLASLELAKNEISDLTPIKDLANIQLLDLAGNKIQDIQHLQKISALQYIELSNNKVKDINPLAGLTNLNALYLGNNQIEDIQPVLGLRRLSSLYLDNNRIKSIKGVSTLSNLWTLSLSGNGLKDITELEGLVGLYTLFLEKNEIKDITPFVKAAERDQKGPQRFTPYINVYVGGNPLSSASKKQLEKLKEEGMRIHFEVSTK